MSSYFGSTNTDKERALAKLKSESLIIQKLRKVILLDDRGDGATQQTSPELDKLLRECNNVKPRELGGFVAEFLQQKSVTPSIIASALGLPPVEVVRLLQGADHKPDLRKLDLIAQLLGVSTGELLDLTRMRRNGLQAHFIRADNIIQSARTYIDELFKGKRLHWWTEVKTYIYDRNKPKGQRSSAKETI